VFGINTVAPCQINVYSRSPLQDTTKETGERREKVRKRTDAGEGIEGQIEKMRGNMWRK
jgi:hypothetical protein